MLSSARVRPALTTVVRGLVGQLYWEKVIEVSDRSSTDGLEELLYIYHDGRVFRSEQRAITLSCPLQLEWMPFDSQTCDWTLGLYSALAEDVTLRWVSNPEGVPVALSNWNMQQCHSHWVPVALRAESAVYQYSSGDYTYANCQLDFVRGNPWRMVGT